MGSNPTECTFFKLNLSSEQFGKVCILIFLNIEILEIREFVKISVV